MIQRATPQLIIKQHFPVDALLETAQLAVRVLIPPPLSSAAVKPAVLMSREVEGMHGR